MRADLAFIADCDATPPAPSASFTLAAEGCRLLADIDAQIAALRERRNDIAAAVTRHVANVAPEHLELLVPGKSVHVNRRTAARKCDDVQRLVAILAARIGEKAFAEDRPPAAIASYIAEEVLRCAGVIPAAPRDKSHPFGTHGDWRSKRIRLHWSDYRPDEWMTPGEEYIAISFAEVAHDDRVSMSAVDAPSPNDLGTLSR